MYHIVEKMRITRIHFGLRISKKTEVPKEVVTGLSNNTEFSTESACASMVCETSATSTSGRLPAANNGYSSEYDV